MPQFLCPGTWEICALWSCGATDGSPSLTPVICSAVDWNALEGKGMDLLLRQLCMMPYSLSGTEYQNLKCFYSVFLPTGGSECFTKNVTWKINVCGTAPTPELVFKSSQVVYYAGFESTEPNQLVQVRLRAKVLRPVQEAHFS